MTILEKSIEAWSVLYVTNISMFYRWTVWLRSVSRGRKVSNSLQSDVSGHLMTLIMDLLLCHPYTLGSNHYTVDYHNLRNFYLNNFDPKLKSDIERTKLIGGSVWRDYRRWWGETMSENEKYWNSPSVNKCNVMCCKLLKNRGTQKKE
jgi:hypothetical protein